MVMTFLPAYARARERARTQACGYQMRQVGLALQIYARDCAGSLPPASSGPAALLPRYLDDDTALHCPTAVYLQDHWTQRYAPRRIPLEYLYRGGLCEDDLPQTAVLADSAWDRHRDGANVLFLDTHVKLLSGALGEQTWRQGEAMAP